ncbi:MAG: DNA-binding response OmpR family regulator, partial [Saprospiraceae bacterium]
ENLIDKQKYYLSTVHQQTRRLLGLVNQLLDFRKAESGHLKLKVANGDFVEFTKEIFLSFEEVAESKNILYQFNVSQREMPMYFDRDNMEIVLCNLLSNAFKYTSGNKIVSLSLKQYAYHEEKPQFPKGYCELVVEDTGQGMSPDILDRIFDRFYQIVNTNSAKLIGTGIGLALVKNIVELHTGKVLAQSKIGQGSKFTVQLPIGKSHFTKEQLIPEYRGAEHESHYQAKFIKHRIKSSVLLPDHISNKNNHSQLLIVEDNLEIRSFLVEIFEKDYVILEASNGREGLEILSDHVPNLIISDLMMPEMDGLTFCRQVRKMEKTTHIPVILLTARTATVFQVEGFQSGADAYITKPFQPAIIRAQVKGLLTSRQRMRESFAKKITLQPTDIEITSHEEEFINKMIQQVEENLDNDDLNRNFLAQSMAMSPSSLYRKLKSLTGFTTNAFIRSIRLKRGAQLMRDTQLNISEIAYLVGFSDLKYFRRCFRDQFDMNPSEYIENQDLLGNDSSE